MLHTRLMQKSSVLGWAKDWLPQSDKVGLFQTKESLAQTYLLTMLMTKEEPERKVFKFADDIKLGGRDCCDEGVWTRDSSSKSNIW